MVDAVAHHHAELRAQHRREFVRSHRRLHFGLQRRGAVRRPRHSARPAGRCSAAGPASTAPSCAARPCSRVAGPGPATSCRCLLPRPWPAPAHRAERSTRCVRCGRRPAAGPPSAAAWRRPALARRGPGLRPGSPAPPPGGSRLCRMGLRQRHPIPAPRRSRRVWRALGVRRLRPGAPRQRQARYPGGQVERRVGITALCRRIAVVRGLLQRQGVAAARRWRRPSRFRASEALRAAWARLPGVGRAPVASGLAWPAASALGPWPSRPRGSARVAGWRRACRAAAWSSACAKAWPHRRRPGPVRAGSARPSGRWRRGGWCSTWR